MSMYDGPRWSWAESVRHVLTVSCVTFMVCLLCWAMFMFGRGLATDAQERGDLERLKRQKLELEIKELEAKYRDKQRTKR